ncbi:MAG: glycosyltransferase family 39 protein [Candidatus Electrothrix scaldis]|nr:MAG: glycosyltransferase family 39 protein [Candidatus Electrothrix sp. GW3-3]
MHRNAVKSTLSTDFLWVLLWLGVLLSALISRPPFPIDETRYLSVAWEMWHNQQFLVPHINGIPYSHKPPLLFWLIHAGWALFGVNAWSARLTAPFFGLFSILLTVRLAKVLWPDQPKWHRNIPYLMLGTCFWALYATLTMFDMLIGFFALLAWLGLWKGKEGKQLLCWLSYGGATALGLLAKGPIILLYILPPALLAPWWMEEKDNFSWFRWYGGLLGATGVGIILALAWAIPAAQAGGKEYGQAILFGQTAGRIVHSFAHQRPWYWYIFLLPALLFPWSFFPPAWSSIRKRQLTPPDKFCLSIILPGFILLSMISGKQVHYLLPLAHPVLLLLNNEDARGNTSAFPFRFLLPTMLFFFALALFILPFLSLKGNDGQMLQFLPPWLGLGPLMIAIILLRTNRTSGQSVSRISSLLVALLIFFQLALSPQLNIRYGATDIVKELHRAQNDKREIAVCPAKLADQFQFAGRLARSVAPLKNLEEAVSWSMQHPKGLVLLFSNREIASFFAQQNALTPRPYKNKWLVIVPADSLTNSYIRWTQR